MYNTAPTLNLHPTEPCPTQNCDQTATFGHVSVGNAITHESVEDGKLRYFQYHANLTCPADHVNLRMVARYFPETGDLRMYKQGQKRNGNSVRLFGTPFETRANGVLLTLPTGLVAIGARGGVDARIRTKVYVDRVFRGGDVPHMVQYARFNGTPTAGSLPQGTVQWYPNLSAFLAAYGA